jgi:hypothetical protein
LIAASQKTSRRHAMQIVLTAAAMVLVMGLAACARDPAAGPGGDSAEYLDARQLTDGNLPLVVVYKSPTCGCCESWVGHMERAGFPVEVHDTLDFGPIKAEAGVPVGKGSCHTALVGQYFVDGHVPADDVKRLVTEQPEGRGLTVPGMPQGSPGMEQSGISEPYDVLLVAKDGSTKVFAHHGD